MSEYWATELEAIELNVCYPSSGGNARLHSHVSKELVSWMARLRLLEGVPFRYLVPYDEILPNESIRFFHIDRNWLDALVDGAMSVARMGSREVEFDKERYEALMDDLHIFERDRRSYANYLLTEEVGDDLEFPSGGTMTGFLFRSSVVRDWPGIEISAFDYLLSPPDQRSNPYISENRIQTMRQEKLSDTVMLCIFNGTPSHVRIQEPYEGMRVGVDTEGARHDNGRAYRTNLKDLDANFLCRICGGSVNTADADPQCEDPWDLHQLSGGAQCPKCYQYIRAHGAESRPCPICEESNPIIPTPTTPVYRTYDVFTRKQPGDNSVLNIQGIYEKGLEQLDYISSYSGAPLPPQDSALLAIQLLQFPYQQDFECKNDYPNSVNTNPTDTSGGA